MPARTDLSFEDEQIEALPTPAAVALSQLSKVAAENSLLTLWHACDAVELMLRFSATLMFSELIRHPDLALAGEGNYTRATLGQWKAIVVGMLQMPNGRVLERAPMFKPLVALWKEGLFDRFFDGRGLPAGGADYARRFTDLRNRIAHGAGLTIEAADILLDSSQESRQPWSARIREFVDVMGHWMATLRLYGRLDGQVMLLRGLRASPVAAEPPPGHRGEQPWVECGDDVLVLWPLMLYDVPLVLDLRLQKADTAVQVYASFDTHTRRVHYTPLGSRNKQVHWSIADPNTTKAFERALGRLKSSQDQSVRGALLSFRQEILDDSKAMTGRDQAVEQLLQAIGDASQPLWLNGKAGSGKSMLMARVVHRLLEARHHLPAAQQRAQRIVPYRFRVGDPRCSKDEFLGLLLASLDLNPKGSPKPGKTSELIEAIGSALQNCVADGTHCIFVFDGLDEMMVVDRTFFDDVLFVLIDNIRQFGGAAAGGRATWLLAGRDSLNPAMEARRAHFVFGPDGLPRMVDKDVRAMILEQLGGGRDDLLRDDDPVPPEKLGTVSASQQLIDELDQGQVPAQILALCNAATHRVRVTQVQRAAAAGKPASTQWLIDDDDDEELFVAVREAGRDGIDIHATRVQSSFISGVTANAEGLPLYVKLVVDDYRNGRFVDFTIGRLPESLEAYYDRLFEQSGVGADLPIRTPIVTLLAIARDAITDEQLALMAADVLRGQDAEAVETRRQLVEQSLAVLASMLSYQRNADGQMGRVLYHQKLREHLTRVPSPDERRHGIGAGLRLDVWIGQARGRLADRCAQAARQGLQQAGCWAPYIARHGIAHLCEAQRHGVALLLLRLLREQKEKADDQAGGRVPDDVSLSALASQVAESLAEALDDFDAAEGPGSLRERFAELDARDLSSLIGRTYETGVYTGVIRLMIELHPRAWQTELRQRLQSPYDLVFRHDVGEAYGSAWLHAKPGRRLHWMRQLLSMARGNDAYLREIAGYALKEIYKTEPDVVDRQVLQQFATSAAVSDRMVAGELILSLTIKDVDTHGWIDSQDFWDPYWPYLRDDVNDILVVMRGHDAAAQPGDDSSLQACLQMHRYADTLRRDLKQTAFFQDPAHADLARLLGGLKDQLEQIDTLDEHATALGSALDEGRVDVVDNFLRLLMCHPLWNVIEAASSLVAKLVERNPTRKSLIGRLAGTDPAWWRVRYGALDSSYNIGEIDRHATFREVLLANFDHPHRRVRGLCADDLLGWLRIGDTAERQRIVDDPGIQRVIQTWVGQADDSWLLEYVYLIVRFVRERVDAGELAFDLARLMPPVISHYLGDADFHRLTHAQALARIEECRRAEYRGTGG